jgi:hypothetical protein
MESINSSLFSAPLSPLASIEESEHEEAVRGMEEGVEERETNQEEHEVQPTSTSEHWKNGTVTSPTDGLVVYPRHNDQFWVHRLKYSRVYHFIVRTLFVLSDGRSCVELYAAFKEINSNTPYRWISFFRQAVNFMLGIGCLVPKPNFHDDCKLLLNRSHVRLTHGTHCMIWDEAGGQSLFCEGCVDIPLSEYVLSDDFDWAVVASKAMEQFRPEYHNLENLVEVFPNHAVRAWRMNQLRRFHLDNALKQHDFRYLGKFSDGFVHNRDDFYLWFQDWVPLPQELKEQEYPDWVSDQPYATLLQGNFAQEQFPSSPLPFLSADERSSSATDLDFTSAVLGEEAVSE